MFAFLPSVNSLRLNTPMTESRGTLPKYDNFFLPLPLPDFFFFFLLGSSLSHIGGVFPVGVIGVVVIGISVVLCFCFSVTGLSCMGVTVCTGLTLGGMVVILDRLIGITRCLDDGVTSRTNFVPDG